MIVDILEEHLEELAFLSMRRKEALPSPDYLPREVAELEERIEAHLQGLLVGGDALLVLVEEKLTGEDPDDAFAAAYALLRLNQQSAGDKLMEAFLEAQDEQLEGFRQALCHGPIDVVRERLGEAVRSAAAPVAVVAAEALAVHEQLPREPERLADWFQDENPGVRCAAWRIAGVLDSRGDH